ncbi:MULTISPECIES: RNA 2',3'-cyclic phosphodiesterase [Shewanella]|uniref:RNA 2',3'-cyclic phosphodiesterase n=1 Tax=Shewanella TaxID=22 RepID=UPI002010AD1C|nr:RNA 2',3'-cyclic phosphodiesterase [Shewanella marisflavi]MCL1040269.1 RNA 2',3'-cyclic phosphodiesterase [Shewanella marisflavi]
MKRLFLAISPNAAQLDTLTQLQANIGGEGRIVPRDNLHMTLAFLGQCSAAQQEALSETLARLAHQRRLPAFEVTLNTLAHWDKPKILCLKGEARDPQLVSLFNLCQRLAQQLGLHTSEHSFQPHITLMRKAKALPDIKSPSLTLNGHALHLYHSQSSEQGVQYEILASWTLT